MEQNVQSNTYSGAEGRGLATILKPYNNDNETANLINQMREVRAIQDQKKVAQQKQVEDIYTDWSKGVWDFDREKIKGKQDELVTKWSKVLSQNPNYVMSGSEQIAFQRDMAEIKQEADLSALHNAKVKEISLKIAGAPGKLDDQEWRLKLEQTKGKDINDPIWGEIMTYQPRVIPPEPKPLDKYDLKVTAQPKKYSIEVRDTTDPNLTTTQYGTKPDIETAKNDIVSSLYSDRVQNTTAEKHYNELKSEAEKLGYIEDGVSEIAAIKKMVKEGKSEIANTITDGYLVRTGEESGTSVAGTPDKENYSTKDGYSKFLTNSGLIISSTMNASVIDPASGNRVISVGNAPILLSHFPKSS